MEGRVIPTDPEDLMRPERLASLPPSRLSASRSLMNRMIDQGWTVELVRFEIDAQARGEALYRVRTPKQSFDFMVFSHQPDLEGRTGRIIGTKWDMMGALVEGEADAEVFARTRSEFPKLYAGRATPGSLVWCRSNRSLRLFDHVIESLAAGEQPDADRLWRTGYLMRNTGLDGNGTFGTRSFLALEPDHALRTPYHAQMLAAYLMREFAVDLAEHLARCADPGAVVLAPELRRSLGLGNGSALGLVFFANNHPVLLDRWLSLRERAVGDALAQPAIAGSTAWQRVEELLARAVTFYEQDPFDYAAFTPSRVIADDLRTIRKNYLAIAHESADGRTFADVVTECVAGSGIDAQEVVRAIMLETRPEQTDELLDLQGLDETLTRRPHDSVESLLGVIRSEYGWIDGLPDSADRYRWYKSRDAEEPRRGPLREVPDGFEWALDLSGDVRRLRARLEEYPSDTNVAEVLVDHPEHRAITQRIQGLAGRRLHSPQMDMLGHDLVPAHVVRLMNSAFHGLDKTVDGPDGRNVLGLLFHGAPSRHDLDAGDHADWTFPARPEGQA